MFKLNFLLLIEKKNIRMLMMTWLIKWSAIFLTTLK